MAKKIIGANDGHRLKSTAPVVSVLMGLSKRARDEQLEAGFILDGPWRGVCPACIDDSALKLFVSSHQAISKCDFCGEPGPAGVCLEDLFKFMAGSLAVEWDDPTNGVGREGREGGWQGVEVFDSYELIHEVGEPFATIGLEEAFAAAFQHDWCQRNPYSAAHHERLGWSWRGFAHYVKHEVRYLFLRTGRATTPYSDVIEPAQFLDELERSIINSGLLRRLEPGTTLYRGRQHGPDEQLTTPAELGSPPRERAQANRMSPAGISMFYAAEELETALAEVRPTTFPRTATVSSWTTARRLAYLDLVDVTIPSIFDAVAGHQRPWLRFLHDFAAEIAQPVAADARSIDYVPTQIVTEFVRHQMLNHAGEPVRGIRYRSAARPGGTSWVLFVETEGCSEIAPGWDADNKHWLGFDASSLQSFTLAWQGTQ